MPVRKRVNVGKINCAPACLIRTRLIAVLGGVPPSFYRAVIIDAIDINADRIFIFRIAEIPTVILRAHQVAR
jgi:hypothetical protein